MKSRFASVALAFLFLSLLSACGGRQKRKDPQAFVMDNWNAIADMAGKGSALRDESKDLPFVSVFSKSRRSQNKAIAHHLEEGRRLLLSENAVTILAQCDKVDGKMAEVSRELEKIRAEKVTNPSRLRKLSRRERKQVANLEKLEREREKARKAAAAEIRAVGLKVDDATIDAFLSNVAANTLIDNAVVAGNVRAAVDRLQSLMRDDDIETSRKYFGMYIVLVDIQLECFRQFLEENEEKWIAGVDRILKEARAARKTAERNAKDSSFSEEQRAIFISNVSANDAVIGAATAYRRMLADQAAAVEEKRVLTEKIRETAQNSYDTVRVAGDFAELVRAGRTTFDAIIGMELPPLSVPADSALLGEFAEITRRLRAEKGGGAK